MVDGTKIEWTDATWNIVNGCSVVSPGCTNCYAMRLAGTRLKHHPSREGLTIDTKAGPVWNGKVRLNEKVLLDPIKWKRKRRIFVCAHGDLFHEAVPLEWRDQVFAVMALASHHDFQVLTKRPERARDYLKDACSWIRIGNLLEKLKPSSHWNGNVYQAKRHINEGQLPNVWLGVSVEDQARADERIPILLDTPASVRWLSCEPLLGPVGLTSIDLPGGWDEVFPFGQECLGREHVDDDGKPMTRIDWVVVGGESGPGARPMHPDWARSLRDQCAAAGVPFLFKQWGEFADADSWMLNGDFAARYYKNTNTVRIGKKRAGRLLDGVQHDGYPA